MAKQKIDEGIFKSIVDYIFNGLDSIILPTYMMQARRKLKDEYPDLYKTLVDYEKTKDELEKKAKELNKKAEKSGVTWDEKDKTFKSNPYTKKK